MGRQRSPWTTRNYKNKIYAYSLADGARRPAKDIEIGDAGVTYAKGIWSDGTTMWVVDQLAFRVLAFDLATGERNTGIRHQRTVSIRQLHSHRPLV